MGSAGLMIAGAVLVMLFAGAGFYLSRKKANGDAAGLFAPRTRRLAFVERTTLDGGRKLILVRRDDKEHLIMIGGPIDLVIETGIPVQGAVLSFAGNDAPSSSATPLWPAADFKAAEEESADNGPDVAAFPKAGGFDKPNASYGLRAAE